MDKRLDLIFKIDGQFRGAINTIIDDTGTMLDIYKTVNDLFENMKDRAKEQVRIDILPMYLEKESLANE